MKNLKHACGTYLPHKKKKKKVKKSQTHLVWGDNEKKKAPAWHLYLKMWSPAYDRLTQSHSNPLFFYSWIQWRIRVSGGKQKKAGSVVFQAELRRQAGDVVKQQTGLVWEKVGQVVMGSAIEKGEGERELHAGEAKLVAELFLMRYWWVRSLAMIKLAVDHQRAAGALRTVCTVMRWKNRVAEWSATLHLKPWFSAFMGIDWKEQRVSANLWDGGALEAPAAVTHTDEGWNQLVSRSVSY